MARVSLEEDFARYANAAPKNQRKGKGKERYALVFSALYPLGESENGVLSDEVNCQEKSSGSARGLIRLGTRP